MGCSAAKNLTVEPLDASLTNGHAETRTSSLAPQPQHNLPPLEAEDLQEELIENNTVNNVLHGVNGVSFEIAFEEEDNYDSIVKKHPPKRILERLEEPSTSPVTLEKLQEKLDEAETRRQQILAQRIQSAGMKTQLKKPLNNDNETDHEEGNFLKVPVVPVEPVSKINNNNNDLSYW